MAQSPRSLTLTPEHVAFIHRAVPETQPVGARRCTDDDYASWTSDILARDPDPHGPLRLFAYGSLIWKPEVDHEAEAPALLRGWHRSFCLAMTTFRGTQDFPGLMMALDRGGACAGLIFTLATGDKPAQLDRLLRREMPFTPPGNLPFWVQPQSATGPVPALAFRVNRRSPRYTGRQPREAVAEVLARACGHGGTCADYLLQTVTHLEARGIRDSLLWQLQDLVAGHIDRAMRSQSRGT